MMMNSKFKRNLSSKKVEMLMSLSIKLMLSMNLGNSIKNNKMTRIESKVIETQGEISTRAEQRSKIIFLIKKTME